MDEKKIEEAAEDIFEDKFLGNGEEIIFTNDEGCEDYREEIYGLIQWKLEQFCIENKTDTMIISVKNKPIVELKAQGTLLEKIKNIIKENEQ